ncbi:MAG: polysaccharide export protein [Kangiellaceae bacterium]|nr:polysaccharide export protein [Kangiellaceae bacterium]
MDRQLIIPRIILILFVSILSACSNLAKVSYQLDPATEKSELELATLIDSIQTKHQPKTQHYKVDRYTPLTLSPGDRLVVDVLDGEDFSGIYEINIDGMLNIPYVAPLSVLGKTVQQVETQLANHLIIHGMLKRGQVSISCRIQQWSAVRVIVSGAVFSPGGVTINNRSIEHKTYMQTQKSGDAPFERFLTTAIRSAGGVRPDADLSQIQMIRNGIVSTYDIRGILEGHYFEDIALVAGDQVVIPSLGVTQNNLMRPSQITPPGFQIFISNLSTPADSNAQSAIGEHSRSIPFGTRLLRGLISANCVGGTVSTNASRVAILVTTDFTTGQTKVVQRSIEDLVRNHNRDEFNPYLMPNDGIACYDSNVTNIRAVARTFSELFNPFLLLSSIGQGD